MSSSACCSNECTACRIDYYHIPDVRMHYSTCDHRVCEHCIARLFGKGRVYPCPACGRNLRAEDFSGASQEARQVEAETQIRRQLCDIFCRSVEDFKTPAEYDDYLERREDIIHRLAHPASQEDEREAWREVDEYKEQNAEHILRAQQLQPRRKLAKILNIIDEEGGFHRAVNSEWGQQPAPGAAAHPFLERYKLFLSDASANGTAGVAALLGRGRATGTAGAAAGVAAATGNGEAKARESAGGSPFAAPQPLLGQHGAADISKQMSGGGQYPDICSRKARHFFFAELAAASRAPDA